MSEDLKTRVQKTLESAGFGWSHSCDISTGIHRLAEDHPGVVIEIVSSSITGNKISSDEVVIRIKMNKRGTDE